MPPEPAAQAAPPDLGAWRASDVLAERCGITVTAAGVEELAARGLIRPAGKYRGCQLYSGEDLAAVDAAWPTLRSTGTLSTACPALL